MTSEHADALLTFGDPFTSRHQSRLLDFAAKHQWPAASLWREFVEAGGLMSYGPSLREVQAAGPALGLAILPMEVHTADE